MQAEILDLMAELKRETGAAMVLITHDMGVIARLADRVCVMKDGAYVEEGPAEEIFAAPADRLHPRPAGRDPAAGPRRTAAAGRPWRRSRRTRRWWSRADDVKVWFPIRRGPVRRAAAAARRRRRHPSRCAQGETLGVVGESGSGKSTLARAVLNLLPATGGAVTLLGRDITHAEREAMRAARKDLQIVFQDPLASLDPRMTIGDSIAEPLQVFRPRPRPRRARRRGARR